NDVPVSEKGRVAFIHPDLGLGGAERLIVDAAVGLKRRGYEVTIYTGYHNPSHAFPETVDGTLKVVPVCQWLPRTLFGRCIALCSYFLVVLPDDLKSLSVIRVYRAPLDFVEELTTGLSDKIVVNSLFTKSVFQETFTRLRSNILDVLYPSINTKLFDEAMKSKSAQKEVSELKLKKDTFLSVNRFERKKNLALAIRTLRKLGTCVGSVGSGGGYDSRLEDSVKYLEELKQICKEEGVVDQVKFVLSPKDDVKVQLISKCVALLYTPSNKHFGIVPLCTWGKPVLAVDSGGPRETVVHEVTGFLCPSNEIHFAAAMATLITEPEIKESMGNAARLGSRIIFI
ncbi:Alpha-1,3/1,6-mannosyltransferase ALG2, partial [Orchesella cincta]